MSNHSRHYKSIALISILFSASLGHAADKANPPPKQPTPLAHGERKAEREKFWDKIKAEKEEFRAKMKAEKEEFRKKIKELKKEFKAKIEADIKEFRNTEKAKD